MGAAMKDPLLRFFAVEHVTLMLIGVALLVHVGRVRARKALTDQARHRAAAIFLARAARNRDGHSVARPRRRAGRCCDVLVLVSCMRGSIKIHNQPGGSDESPGRQAPGDREAHRPRGQRTRRDRAGRHVDRQVPLTAGVVGAVFAPALAAVGAIAALITDCSIAVERGLRRRGGPFETVERAVASERRRWRQRLRRIALGLEGAEEGSHMGAVKLRVGGRIFATLASVEQGYGNLMLTPEVGARSRPMHQTCPFPIHGGWGRNCGHPRPPREGRGQRSGRRASHRVEAAGQRTLPGRRVRARRRPCDADEVCARVANLSPDPAPRAASRLIDSALHVYVRAYASSQGWVWVAEDEVGDGCAYFTGARSVETALRVARGADREGRACLRRPATRNPQPDYCVAQIKIHAAVQLAAFPGRAPPSDATRRSRLP